MHEAKLSYPQPPGHLFPVRESVDLPLNRPDESGGDDVGEMVFLKDLNELPEIKATVGNYAEDRDVAANTRIGSRKKGNDVIPGGNVAGAHPEMDHVFAPVEEGEKGTMARPAMFGRIVAFLCPFLCSKPDEYGGIKRKPVFTNGLPGDKLYVQTFRESVSASFRLLTLLNSRVSVVAAAGRRPAPNTVARTSLFPK